MNMKSRVLLIATVLTAGLILTLNTPVSSKATAVPAPAAAATAMPDEPHPHIRAALHELREAQGELKTAAHDFGGHRAEAMEAVHHAIEQLEVCLKYDKK